MQSVGGERRFWWRGAAPSAPSDPVLPAFTLAVDPSDHPGRAPPLAQLELVPDRDTPREKAAAFVAVAPASAAPRLHAAPGRTPARRLVRLRAGAISLLMTLSGIALFALASLGGTRLTPPGSLVDRLDDLAATAGLAIRDITITGHVNTRDSEVFAALDRLRARSLPGFDTRTARRAVERLAWVEAVSVSRAWPDRIVVAIRERRPAAVWRHDGAETLVDAAGHRLADVAPGVAAGLPVVAGAGAPAAVGELIAELAIRPELAARIGVSERVAGRRWTLVTHTGQRIHLPAGPRAAIAATLDRLTAGRDGTRPIDWPFATLDLRAGDSLVVSAMLRTGRP